MTVPARSSPFNTHLLSIGLLSLALGAAGCIKQALLNGQIASTREASKAFDTIGDFDLAYNAASAGLVQFEGMHVLAPDNTDALFMLARSYSGFGYAFAEDDMENAEDAGERESAEHHRGRAIDAYERAIAYGTKLWVAKGKAGFEEAKSNTDALTGWLEAHFTEPEDAADLLFVGLPWLSRTNLKKDDAEAVAELWVGALIVERAVALDPSYNSYSGLVTLGAYHARSATADLERARALFEDAIAKTERKSLLVLLNYATRYACARGDAALYTKLLQEVLNSEVSEPSMRLMNMLAKRRARRWIQEQRMFEACSLEPVGSEPSPSS